MVTTFLVQNDLVRPREWGDFTKKNWKFLEWPWGSHFGSSVDLRVLVPWPPEYPTCWPLCGFAATATHISGSYVNRPTNIGPYWFSVRALCVIYSFLNVGNWPQPEKNTVYEMNYYSTKKFGNKNNSKIYWYLLNSYRYWWLAGWLLINPRWNNSYYPHFTNEETIV